MTTPGPTAQELVDRVRAAAADSPYRLEDRPDGFDLTIDLADARWLTATAAHRLRRVFTHEVRLDEATRRYTITDIDNEVAYGAGGASLRARARTKRGRVWSYSKHVELGVDATTGRFGKVVDYEFRAGEGRDLVRDAAKDLGWSERMNGTQRGALWVAGITVALLVVTFGAWGISALLS